MQTKIDDDVQLQRLRELAYLRCRYGDELKEPNPESYGFTDATYDQGRKESLEIDEYNNQLPQKRNFIRNIMAPVLFITSVILVDDILLAIFFFAFVYALLFHGSIEMYMKREKSNLAKKYDYYQELFNNYSKEKIGQLLTFEKELKLIKIKSDYWFSLSGHQFEEELAQLFDKTGLYKVKKTPGSGDGGVDIILTEKNGEKLFVQCKAHRKQVGPHTVRDLYGAVMAGGAKEGVLVSLGGVTSGALEFADKNNITIMDANDVVKLAAEINMSKYLIASKHAQT